MKTILATLLGLCSALALAPAAPSPDASLRTPEELDELFAPIALYPDALVALILPAATVPADVASAAAFLAANGDPGQLPGQPWNESVQSLAHYPEIVQWMNENMPWTQQAGDAFLLQPADVMQSIQQLRARAIAAGSLTNTPQQQVLTDGDEIRIVPAQPGVIYVPRYDPEFVYDEQPSYGGPWVTFGVGFPEGVWLNYDLDWQSRGIWIGRWHPGFDFRQPEWRRRPGGAGIPTGGHDWRPPPGRRPVRPLAGFRGPQEIAHPRLLAGAPTRPSQPRGSIVSPGFRPAGGGASVRPDYRGYPSAGQNRPVVTRPAPAPAVAPSPPMQMPSREPGRVSEPARGPTRGQELAAPPARVPAPAREAPRVQEPPREPVRAPTLAPSTVFGGYNRGSDARAASQRGQVSRQPPSAPAARPNVAPAPAARPAPQPPPQPQPSRAAPDGSGGDPRRKKD